MNLKLLVGCRVHISRSDGRVHSASVTSIDTVKSTVKVEWQEGNVCRGKEVEFSELLALNKDLDELINSSSNMDVTAPPPASDKKYASRLRSSRIPAPASSSAAAASKAEETVARRTQARHTAVFELSDSEPARADLEPISEPPRSAAYQNSVARRTQAKHTAVFELPHSDSEPARAPLEPISESPRSAAHPKSAMSNQPGKRLETRQTSVLPSLCVAAVENEEPKTLPSLPTATGRRKSKAFPEGKKGNKRLPSAVKQPDMHTKRGKFGEANRPNFKFYEMIEDFRETLEIFPLSTSDSVEAHRICVGIRKRPLNKQELARREIDVVSVPGNGMVLVHEPKQKVDLTKYLENQTFHFDFCFEETATNELVYWFTARPLVQSIFEGGMATCFAYGQTGSGKTHTMGGDFSGKSQNSAKGIYALAAHDIFSLLSQRRYANLNVSPYVTFFEIYNGKVFDLLNKKAKLRVLEDDRQQVQVVGLEEVEVSRPEDVIKLIEIGTASRTSGQTSANANSSRSHAILQIILRRNDRAATLHGKFSLVDLAGNERGTDVNSNDRVTMVETAQINRSLLALKECIRSLGRNSDHIPFRMSTLTKVLRDSFIGEKSRTCMIAMVSPGMASCDYTLNTLRYADRVKELNGASKASGTTKAQEPMESSSEEDSVVPSMYEAISRVQELDDKVQEEFERVGEIMKSREKIMYDIEEGLPHLLDHTRKLLDTLLALEVAVNEEKMARKSSHCRGGNGGM